jgi:hypothetical protein
VVAHTCNHSTHKAEAQEDWEFEYILGYIVRPYLKTNKQKKGAKQPKTSVISKNHVIKQILYICRMNE